MSPRELVAWGFAIGLEHTPPDEREDFVRLMYADDPEVIEREKRQKNLDTLAGLPGGEVVREA